MLHPYPDPPPGGEPPAPPADPVAVVATPPAVVVPPAVPAPIIPPTQVPAAPVVPAPVVTQPVPAPIVPEPPAPTPEPAPEPGATLSDADREQIEKQANYLARKPEKMDYFLKTLEDATGSSVINSIGSDVTEIKLELAREKAMRTLGLDETDMQFVQGTSPEAILKSAAAFKVHKASFVASVPAADPAVVVATPNGAPAPVVPAPVVAPAPALPQYNTANTPVTEEQAKADLADSLAADGPGILNRLGVL